MEIYGIVMGVVGAVFLIAGLYTLAHRRKMIRKKKSVMALVGSVRRPTVVLDPVTMKPPAPEEHEESAKESSEEESEDARFRSGEEKLRFVMQRWMRVMQEKQAARDNPELPDGEKKAVPVAVKRWRNVLDLIHTEQAKNPRLALKENQDEPHQPRKGVHFEAPETDGPGDVVTAL